MHAAQNKREICLQTSVSYFHSASQQAEAGDLEAAGTLILKALDQERRAGALGPQILQLIKPRN